MGMRTVSTRVEALRIPFAILPKVQLPGTVVGRVTADVSFGLPVMTRVFAPIGDHPASVVAAHLQHQALSTDRVAGLDTNISCASVCSWALLGMATRWFLLT